MNKIDLYHGTSQHVAKLLKNCKVDVSLGGGEFGKGFYLGTSRRLAKRRGFHKTFKHYGTAHEALSYKNNTFVISFDSSQLSDYYSKVEYDRLASRQLFNHLKRNNLTGSYSATPNDYIVGAVAGRKGRYFDVIQYKFDSKKSENILNKQCMNVNVNTDIV